MILKWKCHRILKIWSIIIKDIIVILGFPQMPLYVVLNFCYYFDIIQEHTEIKKKFPNLCSGLDMLIIDTFS